MVCPTASRPMRVICRRREIEPFDFRAADRDRYGHLINFVPRGTGTRRARAAHRAGYALLARLVPLFTNRQTNGTLTCHAHSAEVALASFRQCCVTQPLGGRFTGHTLTSQ